jgi:hypothetical protein
MKEKSTLEVADRENGTQTEIPLQADNQEKFTPESSRERETE